MALSAILVPIGKDVKENAGVGRVTRKTGAGTDDKAGLVCEVIRLAVALGARRPEGDR
jgi:hypothetical protein